jgi:hypothetical protein
MAPGLPRQKRTEEQVAASHAPSIDSLLKVFDPYKRKELSSILSSKGSLSAEDRYKLVEAVASSRHDGAKLRIMRHLRDADLHQMRLTPVESRTLFSEFVRLQQEDGYPRPDLSGIQLELYSAFYSYLADSYIGIAKIIASDKAQPWREDAVMDKLPSAILKYKPDSDASFETYLSSAFSHFAMNQRRDDDLRKLRIPLIQVDIDEVEDNSVILPLDGLLTKEALESMFQILNSERIDDTNRLILKLRFGVGTRMKPKYTLDELKDAFGFKKKQNVLAREKSSSKMMQRLMLNETVSSPQVVTGNSDVFLFEELGITPKSPGFRDLVKVPENELQERIRKHNVTRVNIASVHRSLL